MRDSDWIETRRELFAWIDSQGWKPGEVNCFEICTAIWHRKFPDVQPGCFGNPGKPLMLTLRAYARTPHTELGFDLELKAACNNEAWIRLSSYDLHDGNIRELLEPQVKKIIRAWKAMNEDIEPLQEVDEEGDSLPRLYIRPVYIGDKGGVPNSIAVCRHNEPDILQDGEILEHFDGASSGKMIKENYPDYELVWGAPIYAK